MCALKKKDVENIFVNSNSTDELFDAFRAAIENKIKDVALYKSLLWNKALSPDEISMYAEKVCKELPDCCFKIYYAVGQILESISVYGIYYERAMNFFKKAAKAEPDSHEPYVAIAKMYNFELDCPSLKNILKTLEQGLETVHLKSKVCFALSSIYKKTGDKENEKLYQSKGEKYQRELQ